MSPPNDVPWYRELPELRPEDLRLLRDLLREVNDALVADEMVSDRDVLHLALQELLYSLRSSAREDKVLRLLLKRRVEQLDQFVRRLDH